MKCCVMMFKWVCIVCFRSCNCCILCLQNFNIKWTVQRIVGMQVERFFFNRFVKIVPNNYLFCIMLIIITKRELIPWCKSKQGNGLAFIFLNPLFAAIIDEWTVAGCELLSMFNCEGPYCIRKPSWRPWGAEALYSLKSICARFAFC